MGDYHDDDWFRPQVPRREIAARILTRLDLKRPDDSALDEVRHRLWVKRQTEVNKAFLERDPRGMAERLGYPKSMDQPKPQKETEPNGKRPDFDHSDQRSMDSK